MIISKTPFRISFIGGGSDLESYYQYNGGAVISSTIDKYIYQSTHRYFETNESLIKYSKTELVKHHSEINHPIIKNLFSRFDINQIDYNSTADIPAGTGMGSSSSFTVGLINLCCEIKGVKMTKYEIADLASKIEIVDLKEPIGKQDQFAASFGGLNLINFNQNGSVVINPINLTREQRIQLNGELKLFYTGIRRSASSVLKDQKSKMKDLEKRKIIDKMVSFVHDLYYEFKNGRIEELGNILHEGWLLKKTISNKISSSQINDIYNAGLNAGAVGGKLLGAGAGGFILFYVPREKNEIFNKKFNLLKEYEFNFEYLGTQIIYNNEK
tara:strand:- start:11337 stop:12317 length:981 start_codon:yes stop_codon:yes gene_type:complete